MKIAFYARENHLDRFFRENIWAASGRVFVGRCGAQNVRAIRQANLNKNPNLFYFICQASAIIFSFAYLYFTSVKVPDIRSGLL